MLSVPTDQAELLAATRAKNAAEQTQMDATEAGTLDRSWVDKALREAGCEYLD